MRGIYLEEASLQKPRIKHLRIKNYQINVLLPQKPH